eukprot:c52500_g1_i1.p1 GENE.c52500_g1_i1~~c52500_g1_i1.p1  ORF type:complete len:244 (+),score=53.62 c52500_g1_i1:32-733(+)
MKAVALVVVMLAMFASVASGASYYFLGHYSDDACTASMLDEIVVTFSENCNAIPYGNVKVQSDGSVIIYSGPVNFCDGLAVATVTKTCNGKWKILGTSSNGMVGNFPKGAFTGTVSTAFYTSACSSSATTQTYTSGVVIKPQGCVPAGQSNVYSKPNCAAGGNVTLSYFTSTDCSTAAAGSAVFPSACTAISGKNVQGACRDYSEIQSKSSAAAVAPAALAIIAVVVLALVGL